MFIRRLLDIFALSPEKAPDFVKKHPTIIMGLAAILLVCSIWLIFGWLDGTERLPMLLIGLFSLAFSASGFVMWSNLRERL